MLRCLRFTLQVTQDGARLAIRWHWLCLPEQDFHLQDKCSFSQRTEHWIRKTLARYPDVVISPYSNGLMIRVGKYPDLTPLPGSVPESYFAINQLIRPIRVIPREGHSLHFYGAGHFNSTSTLAWYARYDRGPLHVTPVRTGEPMLVSGFWRTDS
ncbi:Protein of unknown function (DUF3396) [Photorhabdus khanii NC19]|uniref:Uncharacterized protein n=1 Tax=Photorhabdus khanii NC19 TaxID=1004151 RepID=W3V9Y7_9GAMM|nr:Protein of unknown function (DUF3396) [Photorhabdus khanii NC19]